MTKTQKACGILAVAIFILGCIVFWYNNIRTPSFTPPAIEANAEPGIPFVPGELGYSELKQEGMPYSLHVCGVCAPDENGQLDLYFTNDKENTVLLALEVYEGDTLVGKTGVLKPNEYVKSVQVEAGELAVGDAVSYKIIGYNMEDYSSVGSVVLNTEVSEYIEIEQKG